MASWVLVPCLVSLRAEFNALAPGRDKASDGAVADAAHYAGGSSDHIPDEEVAALRSKDADSVNEVHAIDVDSDLHRPGWSMDRATAIVITRHRTGRDDRLQNVIWNRTIWSRSWGWTARAYTGASPHTEHAHFSARYTTAQEQDTRPWGLLEADDMDAAQTTAWARSADGKAALADAIAGALLDGSHAARNDDIYKQADAATQRRMRNVNDALRIIVGGPVDQAAIVAAIAAGQLDPTAVVTGVLAAFDPQRVADLVIAALPADQARRTADELAARLAA